MNGSVPIQEVARTERTRGSELVNVQTFKVEVGETTRKKTEEEMCSLKVRYFRFSEVFLRFSSFPMSSRQVYSFSVIFRLLVVFPFLFLFPISVGFRIF